MSPTTIRTIFLKEITSKVICTLLTRYIYTLHWNKRTLVCASPSADVQFGYTDGNDE